VNTSDTIAADVPVITVDGPGGSGKGTVTTRLASYLGWHFLDSGALYRLTALSVMKRQVSLNNETALGELAADLDIRFETNGIEVISWLDGENVSDRLRNEETSSQDSTDRSAKAFSSATRVGSGWPRHGNRDISGRETQGFSHRQCRNSCPTTL
jgi:cytidylate kinase